MVQELMDAPLKPTSPDYFGTISVNNIPTNLDDYFGTKDLNHYGIDFLLKDGTWVIRDYRMDTGRLSKVLSYYRITTPATGIVAPQAFREAIKEGVTGFLKQLEAQKAEEQRQKRTCADTRTSQEARTINPSGVPYTTIPECKEAEE